MDSVFSFLAHSTKKMVYRTIDDILDSMKHDIIIIPQSAEEKTEPQRVYMTYHSFILQETKASSHKRLSSGQPASMRQR